MTIEGFVTMWPAVMDALSGHSRVAWMAFSGSQPLSWSDGVLAVGLDSQGKATGVVNGGHDETLRAAITDVLRVEIRIDVVFAPNAAAPAANKSASTKGSNKAVVEGDTPSPDDATVDDVTGVELIMRELGGTQIGEIEH